MSEELVAAGIAPESPGATLEQGCKPQIIENLQALAMVGKQLRQKSFDDYGIAVLAEQIEILRNTANALDCQYSVNVRGRKIKFKDRVAYLAVRERVASTIVDFTENLCRLRLAETPTVATEGEQGCNFSWNPDAASDTESQQAAR